MMKPDFDAFLDGLTDAEAREWLVEYITDKDISPLSDLPIEEEEFMRWLRRRWLDDCEGRAEDSARDK